MSQKTTNLANYAVVWGFLISLPNPAIPLTDRFSLQFGVVASSLLLVLVPGGTKTICWRVFLLITASGFLSLALTVLPGAHFEDIAIKAIVARAIDFVPMIAGGLLLRNHWVSVLRGLALASMLHFAVGVIQLIEFNAGSFPFAALFNNRQFGTLDAHDLQGIVRNVRPFGLYPEASATAAATSPFVVIAFALILNMVKLPSDGRRTTNTIIKAGGVLGLALILMSKSGQGPILAISIAVLLGGAVFSQPVTQAFSLGRITLMAGTVGAMILGVVQLIRDRTNIDIAGSAVGNSSWLARADSIVSGLSIWLHGTFWELAFGFGGQCSAIMLEKTPYPALCSVIGEYIFDTGIMGCLVLTWIVWYAIRSIRQSSCRLVGALVLINWFVGSAGSTSYFAISPMWFSLAACLYWRSLFPRRISVSTGPQRPRSSFPLAAALKPRRTG